jgi:hypothetical protein
MKKTIRTVGKRLSARHLLRDESGVSTLSMVLVLLVLGAVILTPLLYLVITGQRAGSAHDEMTQRY